MGALSANTLATTAIVLGALAVGACFLTWAEPRRPAQEIAAELERGLHAPQRPVEAPQLIGGLREAYAQPGTRAPLHGIWVAILAGIAVLVTVVAASLGGEGRAVSVETTYRVAGAIFMVATLIVLIDCSSGLFQRKDRGLGLWIALGASLAAALAATFASARIEESADVPESVDQDGSV